MTKGQLLYHEFIYTYIYIFLIQINVERDSKIEVSIFLLRLIISPSLFHPVFIIFFYISIPSHPSTSNDSCDRLNSNQLSQFFINVSVINALQYIIYKVL